MGDATGCRNSHSLKKLEIQSEEEMTLREGLLWQLRKGLTQEAVEEAKRVYFSKYGSEPREVLCSQAHSPIPGVTQDRGIPLGVLLLTFSQERPDGA